MGSLAYIAILLAFASAAFYQIAENQSTSYRERRNTRAIAAVLITVAGVVSFVGLITAIMAG